MRSEEGGGRREERGRRRKERRMKAGEKERGVQLVYIPSTMT